MALDELELAPLGRALARAADRARVFGDEPLPPLGLRFRHQRGAVTRDPTRQIKDVTGSVPEHALEPGALLLVQR